MSAMTLGAPSIRDRTPSWLLVVLFVSLAANLLVIGSVGTAMWRFRHGPPPPPAVMPNLIGYASSLKGERFTAVRDATEPLRQKLRPLRQELRVLRNEVTAAISAEPFDNAAFEAAQARLSEREGQVRQAMTALYAEIARNLTPDERRAYSRWREHRRGPPPSILEDEAPPPGGPPPRRP